MILKIFFLILVTIYSESISTCIKFQCLELAGNICANATNLDVKLKGCKDSKICDFGLSKNLSTCEKYVKSRYPGEYCEDDNECLKGDCVNNHCLVSGIHDKCYSNIDCNPKFYCNNKECMPVAIEGGNCSKVKCDSGLICNFNKCIKIGSKKLQEPATVPAACQSYYIHNKMCEKGPILKRKLNNEGPIVCDKSCTYITKANSFHTSCTCGKTKDGILFCNPGIGDINIDDV